MTPEGRAVGEVGVDGAKSGENALLLVTKECDVLGTSDDEPGKSEI